LLGGTFRKSA